MPAHAEFLMALADRLDIEGKPELADVIDKDFEEFLELLESGEFECCEPLSGGSRDPRTPYGNRGRQTFLADISGPQ